MKHSFTSNSRSGFTLIEMLVVITIMGILMSLLMPAINGIRNNARHTQCVNNMKQVSTAVYDYNAHNLKYPYYREKFSDVNSNWIISILQSLGERAMAEAWTNNGEINQKTGNISCLRCPANPLIAKPTNGIYANSYVANCGLEGMTDKNNMADCGVFVDGTTGQRVQRNSLERIASLDGTSYTVAVAENNQAGVWVSESAVAATEPYQIGVMWVKSPSDCHQFNRCNNVTTISAEYARPSSHHEGGANIAFCDNHVSFVNNSISYTTYCQIMAPNDAKAASISGKSELTDPLKTTEVGP
ncbi:MAG: DUF1559 domain-containing protein [Planctomycetia bacterium]|nr:DUF1559 domain-containing protein [Planctomycetia bacterium]